VTSTNAISFTSIECPSKIEIKSLTGTTGIAYNVGDVLNCSVTGGTEPINFYWNISGQFIYNGPTYTLTMAGSYAVACFALPLNISGCFVQTDAIVITATDTTTAVTDLSVTTQGGGGTSEATATGTGVTSLTGITDTGSTMSGSGGTSSSAYTGTGSTVTVTVPGSGYSSQTTVTGSGVYTGTGTSTTVVVDPTATTPNTSGNTTSKGDDDNDEILRIIEIAVPSIFGALALGLILAYLLWCLCCPWLCGFDLDDPYDEEEGIQERNDDQPPRRPAPVLQDPTFYAPGYRFQSTAFTKF
jgi:hypothetical protein